jgi:hypothetical protein
MKHVKHHSSPIDLRKAEVGKELGNFDAFAIVTDFANAIQTIDEEMSNCPNCGGIVPEICVLYKGKVFKFTCYDIVKGKKSLLKTDCKLMESYLAMR